MKPTSFAPLTFLFLGSTACVTHADEGRDQKTVSVEAVLAGLKQNQETTHNLCIAHSSPTGSIVSYMYTSPPESWVVPV